MSQLALACLLILKEKKRKRKRNNDLADLPSHDISPQTLVFIPIYYHNMTHKTVSN